jgi:hypothetical protein
MNEGVNMTDPRIGPVRAQLQKYATAEEVLAAADAADPARAALARIAALADDWVGRPAPWRFAAGVLRAALASEQS